MGRKRSNYICPKCGKPGRCPRLKSSKYGQYLYVEHYDPINKKISKTCYINTIINESAGSGIYSELFNKVHSGKHSLKNETIKLKSTIADIIHLIEKTDISAEDERILATLIREGAKELRLISWTYSKNRYLRNKVVRTKEEEMLFDKTERAVRDFNKTIEQTQIMTDLINRHQKGEIKDLETPKIRKIIRENALGIIRFSNLSFNKAFAYWFKKYEQPKREAYRKQLNKKLSESAFGSDKYRSQYSGISEE